MPQVGGGQDGVKPQGCPRGGDPGSTVSPTSQTSREYRGRLWQVPDGADRFGPDHHPVGPSACARRGCPGCCYCIGQAPLPIYLKVLVLKPPVWSRGMICDRAALDPWRRAYPKWLSLDKLGCLVEKHASTRPKPLPAST